MNRNLLWVVGVLVVVGGFYLLFAYQDTAPVERGSIGGDRDEHGCLMGGGYGYDEDVGACIRAFEMTRDIKAAAKLAVESVGREYALTVISFNSYEERGAYDITLEHGEGLTKQTVKIRGNKVVSDSD